MLKAIFGSETRGKILLFLYTNGESYPTEMSRSLGYYLYGIQKHLLNMEKDGILYSRLKGKTRLYGMNPRYPFKRELISLLEKILVFVPKDEKERLYRPRLRPRLAGKPS